MKITKYGEYILTEDDLFNFLYTNNGKTIKHCFTDKEIIMPSFIENPLICTEYIDKKLSIEEFDTIQQNNYYLPDKYKNLNIVQYILDLCKTETELQRVGQELLLFNKYNMLPLLNYLLYLVDIMKNNNIVWGVGRGSSVSSYVLYLLGVHKINSIYYDLSIDEFFKPGEINES